MERCLYHPSQGFYGSGAGIAGRRGDFITSPEVGPLFGEVLANALDAWWEQLGRPDPYRVIDVGSGPGTLAKVLNQAPGISAPARQIVGVDRALSDTVDDDQYRGAVVVANELLDNMPFRIVERSGSDQWHEVYVDWSQGTPTESMVRLVAQPDGLHIPEHTRAPIHQQAHDWVRSILERGAAKILVFDYGVLSTFDLAARGGWLRTYRRHERQADPYNQPGAWDITTDIGFDQLPTPTQITTQADFLNHWGASELLAEGKAYWQAHASAPDLKAFKMRSRASEYLALTDPDGLGSWLAATWTNDTGLNP